MRKKHTRQAAAALIVFLLSTLVFYRVDPSDAMTAAWIDEKELGAVCVGQIVPEARKQQDNEENMKKTGQIEEKDDVKSKVRT